MLLVFHHSHSAITKVQQNKQSSIIATASNVCKHRLLAGTTLIRRHQLYEVSKGKKSERSNHKPTLIIHPLSHTYTQTHTAISFLFSSTMLNKHSSQFQSGVYVLVQRHNLSLLIRYTVVIVIATFVGFFHNASRKTPREREREGE